VKKTLPPVIISLIIILSAILMFHIITNENEPPNQSNDQQDPTVEISTEINNLLLEEQTEIDIGKMI
jgi:uncharacterized alpha/beta hydrolase family protein